MGTDYTETIQELRNGLDQFRTEHGITVEPLETLLDQLELRLNDVTTVEENVEAVRRVIMDPVEEELRSGQRKARIQFWIGVFGIGLSFLTWMVSLTGENELSEYAATQIETLNDIRGDNARLARTVESTISPTSPG